MSLVATKTPVGKIPDHWIGCKIEVAFGPPIPDRNGAIKYNSFDATILADYESTVELETAEKIRLYPKSDIRYLAKARAVVEAPSGLILT